MLYKIKKIFYDKKSKRIIVETILPNSTGILSSSSRLVRLLIGNDDAAQFLLKKI